MKYFFSFLLISCSHSDIRHKQFISSEESSSETKAEQEHPDSDQPDEDNPIDEPSYEPIIDESSSQQSLTDNDLPDLLPTLDPNACDDTLQGQAGMEGATSYYIGTFINNEEYGWEGKEIWQLFPNEHWNESGGRSCFVEWDIYPTPLDSSYCNDCTYVLEVEAELRLDTSTCPASVLQRVSDWHSRYRIRISGERSTFSYHSNGEVFGTGHVVDNAINFSTDAICFWL